MQRTPKRELTTASVLMLLAIIGNMVPGMGSNTAGVGTSSPPPPSGSTSNTAITRTQSPAGTGISTTLTITTTTVSTVTMNSCILGDCGEGSSPTPSMTPVIRPTATPTLSITDTPSPTPTPSATTVASTYHLAPGPLVGAIIHPDGVNIWNPQMVISQTSQLPKLYGLGVREVRMMGLGAAITTTNKAVDALLRAGMTPALAFGSRDYPDVLTLDERGEAVRDTLIALIDRYGSAAAGWRLEGGNEEPNATEIVWYKTVLSATVDAETARAAVLDGATFRLCTPAPVTMGYNSLERMLRAVQDEHLRADCIALHWYGQAAPLQDHLAETSASIQRYAPNLPVYLTEWAMAGHREQALRTNVNAVWLIDTLATSPGLGRYDGMNFSAGIGQSYGYTNTVTGQPEGFLGLIAFNSDHAMYPVARALELWNRMGPHRYEVSGLSPPDGPLHAITDDAAQWLLWNNGNTLVTATIPCTMPMAIGRIDGINGNSFTIWQRMTRPIDQGGEGIPLTRWTQGESDRLYLYSDPFKVPWTGAAAPKLSCDANVATVLVPSQGIVYMGAW